MKSATAFLAFASTVFSPVLSFVQEEEDTLLQLQVKQSTEGTAMWCKDGIKNKECTHCCPKDCGTCGGPGCGARPGGKEQCCVGHIANKTLCDIDESVTCKLPPAWCAAQSTEGTAMWCKEGIKNKACTHCCPAACETCGGPGCGDRPGGAPECCVGHIAAKLCTHHTSVACKLPEAWCAAPTEAPTEAPPAAPTYVIGDRDGKCPAGSNRVQWDECQGLVGTTLFGSATFLGHEYCNKFATPGAGCFIEHPSLQPYLYSTEPGCTNAGGHDLLVAVCKKEPGHVQNSVSDEA